MEIKIKNEIFDLTEQDLIKMFKIADFDGKERILRVAILEATRTDLERRACNNETD